MPIPNDRVIIYKEDLEYYRKLEIELDCLDAHGVDNWRGYGDAMSEAAKILEEREDE